MLAHHDPAQRQADHHDAEQQVYTRHKRPVGAVPSTEQPLEPRAVQDMVRDEQSKHRHAHNLMECLANRNCSEPDKKSNRQNAEFFESILQEVSAIPLL